MGPGVEPSTGPPPIPRAPDVEVHVWHFDGALEDVGTARHLVTETLHRHDWEHSDVQVVELLVSELATNAVIHAQSPFAVTAWIDGVASVAISDQEPDDHPVPAERDLGQGGMGLKLVASLANRWGVHARDDGKAVWFEFDPESAR